LTEPTDRDRRALERFYRREILPLASRPEAHLRRPEAGAASYWVVRDRPPLRAADFELALGDRAAAAATLDRFWQGTALAGLGRRLVRLGRRFEGARIKKDVSDFVYEMF
jgi:hypothetical protein